MRTFTPRHTALIASLFLIVSSSPIVAETPPQDATLERGETTVSIGGLARTRLSTSSTQNNGVETPQATLVMARMRAKATHHDVGAVHVELDLATPTHLLDLYSEVSLGSPVSARLGLFKVPLSREMIMPIASHPIFERTWITQQLGVRRRAGAAIVATVNRGTLRADLQTGVFNPTMNFNKMLNDGVLWVSAFDLKAEALHTDLHIAYMEHLFTPQQTLDPVTMAPLYPRDHQLDVALYHEQKRLRTLVEGIVAINNNGASTDTSSAYALHALLSRELRARPAEEGGYGLEVGTSLDYLALEDGAHLRVTGNLSWLIASHKLQLTLANAFEPALGAQQPSRYIVLAQLQGSF